MFIYVKLRRQSLAIDGKLFWQLAGIGTIIMVHWLAFYGAIKVSNISITMVAFSTGALFSAFIEPVFFKRRLRAYEIVIGLIIITGIALVISVELKYRLGIFLGIFAAFTSALFSVLNGLMAKKLPSAVISFYELGAALVGLTVFLFCTGHMNGDFFTLDRPSVTGILLLSLVCTVFPFISSVHLTRYISPYTIVLTVNLETVYGIIWAIIYYQENKDLSPTFYVGVLIILAAIFLNSWLRRLAEKKTGQDSVI